LLEAFSRASFLAFCSLVFFLLFFFYCPCVCKRMSSQQCDYAQLILGQQFIFFLFQFFFLSLIGHTLSGWSLLSTSATSAMSDQSAFITDRFICHGGPIFFSLIFFWHAVSWMERKVNRMKQLGRSRRKSCNGVLATLRPPLTPSAFLTWMASMALSGRYRA